ncbi:MAG TPA: malonic semialdehyde reductase [Terricaulis sp.]|nr:malonic semialdehyde reductase [Terricaulis sp.]
MHPEPEIDAGVACVARLFDDARTFGAWRAGGLSEAIIRRLYDALRLGPTANNCAPARFVFVASAEAKARLEPHLSEGNKPKMRAAPVCVIIGHDLDFHTKMGALFPHKPETAAVLAADPARAREVAFRNSSLQGAYLIMAARALGLDCGPMSGFNNSGVDQEFFAGTQIKSNFLCNIGYGDRRALRPRLPRLCFEEACEVV